jgi:hypothetical protein
MCGSQDHAFLKDSIRFLQTVPPPFYRLSLPAGTSATLRDFPEFNKLALKFLMHKE